MKFARVDPLILSIVGAALMIGTAWVFVERAKIDVAGVIVSSNTDCPDSARPHYRCITTYKILADGAKAPIEYVTAGTDPSLPQRLPVGTKLVKKKGSISYTVNGKVVNDLLSTHVPLCVIGATCFVFGMIGTVRELQEWWSEASIETGA